MKKRFLICILSMMLLVSSVGCDKSNNTDNTSTDNNSSNNSVISETFEYDENYKYKIDYNYLENYYFSLFNGEYLNLYYNIINSVIAHDTEVIIPQDIEDLYYTDNVIKGFMHINPLQSFVKTMTRNDNVIFIEYRFDEQEHKQELQYMDKKLTSILDEIIKPEFNDFQRVLAIYTYVSSSFSYDFTYDVENQDKIDVYDFLKNNKGVCHSYARLCKFLIYQYGISTYEARAYSPDGVPHEWFMAEIDECWYHFDPTYENTLTKGSGLKYFAMNDNRRFQNGGFSPVFTAGISPLTTTPPSAVFDNLSVLDNVVSYKTDIDGTLMATLKDGSTMMFDYSEYVIN